MGKFLFDGSYASGVSALDDIQELHEHELKQKKSLEKEANKTA